MPLPSNVLHYYVGFVVVAAITAELWKRSKIPGQINSTLKNIAITCGISTAAMFFYGFPVLVTHDRNLLSYGTLIADSLQFIATMFLWFILTKAYLGTKPALRNVANFLVIASAVVFISLSAVKNFSPPYGSYVITNGDSITLVGKGYAPLAILSGINSISLILMGFFFRKQAKSAPKRSQRIRIRSFAFAFFAAGIALVSELLIGHVSKDSFGQYLFIVSFSVVVLAGVASFVINRRAAK